jgi:hypothetical protein
VTAIFYLNLPRLPQVVTLKLGPKGQIFLVPWPRALSTLPLSLTWNLVYSESSCKMYHSADDHVALALFPVSSLPDKKAERKYTPWIESASKLYPSSDRRLSANVVPTFADRLCQVVSVTNPYGRILGFLDRAATFPSKQLLIVLTRLWTLCS